MTFSPNSDPNSSGPKGHELVPFKKDESIPIIDVDVIQDDAITPRAPEPPKPTKPIPLPRPKKPTFWEQLIATTPKAFLFLIPILILLYPGFEATVSRASEAIRFEFQLDREEGFILNQAILLSNGESLYQPIDEAPYLVGNYPPVYQAIVAELLRVQPPSLKVARFVILISALLILVVLLAFLYDETGSVYPGILAVFLCMGYYGFRDWIAYARVDIPAIGFGLAGLAIVANKHRLMGITLGCILFSLAFLTKQTQVIAPAAAFFGLFWINEKKLALILAAGTSAICGSTLFLWNTQTNGELFKHLVEYNKNSFHFDWYLLFLQNGELVFAPGTYLALLLALVGAVLYKRVRGKSPKEIDPATHRPKSRALPMVVFYAVFALLSTVSAAKVGSAVNYFLEFHLAASLLIALVIGLAAKELPFQEGSKRTMLYAVLGMVYFGVSVQGIWNYIPQTRLGGRPPLGVSLVPIPTNDRTYSYVLLQVAEATDPVLSDDPIFQIMTEKEVIYQPFIMAQLSKEGRWDQGPFVQRILDREFELIILTEPIRQDSKRLFASITGWTDEMLQAMAQGYKFNEQVGKFYLYIRLDDDRGKSALELVGS